MSLARSESSETLNAHAAEQRAARIGLRLDSAAESFEAAMEMMRAAIRARDDIALGYRSPGDYLSDRFGGKLARLGVDLRREVVRELTEAGLSTRAIAPVLGIGNATVHRDRAAVSDETPQTPEPAAGGEALTGSGQTSASDEDRGTTERESDDALVDDQPEDEPRSAATATPAAVQGPLDAPPARPPVTGIDGKTYTPPTRPVAPAPRRRPLPDAARDAGWDLRKAVERVQRITADDRFTANAEQVTPHLRSHLSHAIEVCQDLLDRTERNN